MKNELNEFLGNERKQFDQGELLENNTPAEPFSLFNAWLKSAIDAKLPEAYSMVLATSLNGKPSQRVVYLRQLEGDGLVFFTNYLSKKGIEIRENRFASLLFFWPQLERQIRLEGKISIASSEISNNYFNTRPRNSQLGAWASEQSKIISSRDELNKRMLEFDEKFKDQQVPRPENWGGFILEPVYFEFWQGRSSRLHDRISYEKTNGNWKKYRLAP